ncbi:unnamed protein product [Toxocara canis]|uniref:SSD domain-containing protein n=1 Tax=Toxocara canis TaxID=6265 RepID=A0A183TX93_TOXCA|nr:unnamed protein product [Toxocara canis]
MQELGVSKDGMNLCVKVDQKFALKGNLCFEIPSDLRRLLGSSIRSPMLTQFAKKMRDAARLLPKILRCHGIDQGVSWRFDEDSSEYKAICGLIHVKYLAPVCLLMKCLILGYFVTEKIYERHIILNVATLFLLLLGASSSVFLLVGIKAKKYTLVIPYFMACGVAILLVAMKSFVDLLDTANTKDTLKAYRLRKLIAQASINLIGKTSAQLSI